MKKVKVEDAIGMVLGHDMTKIVPGVFKGAAFKKGHVIKEEDIPELLAMGKEHIFVLEMTEEMVHEDDAAQHIAKLIVSEDIVCQGPREGKISFYAPYDGLLKINADILDSLNEIENISIATIHGNRMVKKGELLGGTRIIPLIIGREELNKVTKTAVKEVIQVKKLKPHRCGLVVTGSEVYKGTIKDKFGPVIKNKLMELGSLVETIEYTPDDKEIITKKIIRLKETNHEIIIVTGGMSVDPDDQTPGAIKGTGARVVTYGTPILPGAMLMLAYLDGTPVFGLPGCVMYEKITAFDLLLPRVLAGEILTKKDITRLGYGGQCQSCITCVFPNCSFGKDR
jgi:molybdenum cofactor synthesis domain-containing protein